MTFPRRSYAQTRLLPWNATPQHNLLSNPSRRFASIFNRPADPIGTQASRHACGHEGDSVRVLRDRARARDRAFANLRRKFLSRWKSLKETCSQPAHPAASRTRKGRAVCRTCTSRTCVRISLIRGAKNNMETLLLPALTERCTNITTPPPTRVVWVCLSLLLRQQHRRPSEDDDQEDAVGAADDRGGGSRRRTACPSS